MEKYTIYDNVVFARVCRSALEELFREVSRYENMSPKTNGEAYKHIKELNLKAKKVFDAYISCYEFMQKEFIVDGDVINILSRYSAYTPKDTIATKINEAIRLADDNDYEALLILSVKHRCGVALSKEGLDLIESYSI